MITPEESTTPSRPNVDKPGSTQIPAGLPQADKPKQAEESNEQRQHQSASPVHGWLERHRILFETFAAIVLSIASVWVGWLQWKSAEREAEYTKLQADIERRQCQPDFVLSTHLIKNAGETFFSNEEMHIQNFGGPARDLYERTAVWLNVTLFQGGQSVETNLPVVGYYSGCFRASDAVNGRIITLAGDQNNAKFFSLSTSLMHPSETNQSRWMIELRQFVKLSYSDLLETQHTEYFRVYPVDGGRRIPDQEGKEWVEGFTTDFRAKGGLEFSTVTPEEVLERVSNLVGK